MSPSTAITFYSYKGGVGRTLAIANTAEALAELGQRVVVVDFDLEAPGLHYKLPPPSAISCGVVDLVSRFLERDEMPPVEECLYKVPVPKDADTDIDDFSPGTIQVLPAGAVSEKHYWRSMAGIDWRRFFVGSIENKELGRGVPFFVELKRRLIEATKADYILFDARTGITELGGVATSILPDVMVCLFANNEESIEGTARVLSAVRAGAAAHGKRHVRVLPVLTRIPVGRSDEERIVADVSQRLHLASQEDADSVIVLHSHDELQVSERLLIGREARRGTTAERDAKDSERPPLFYDYLKLCNRLVPSTVEEYLERVVKTQQTLVFKEPVRALEKLRQLAQRFPHAITYRGVLEVLRVRESFTIDTLRFAENLVRLTGEAREPLAWDVVRAVCNEWDLDVLDEFDEEEMPLRIRDLDFVRRVWLAHSAKDTTIGLWLIRAYRVLERGAVAKVLAADMAKRVLSSELEMDLDSLVELARDLMNSELVDTALELLRSEPLVVRSQDGVRLWARAVIQLRNKERAIELLERPELVERSLDRATWIRLLGLADRMEEATMKADAEVEALVQAIRTGSDSRNVLRRRVLDLHRFFASLNRADQLSRRLGDLLADRPAERRFVTRTLEALSNSDDELP